MNEFKFNLGDEVQDQISKFKGIIRARSQYMTGCNTYAVQSQKLKSDDIKVPGWNWLDEGQLKLLKKEKVKLNLDESIKKNKVGGPNNSNQFAPER